MKKIIWALAVILTYTTSVFALCSNNDNPSDSNKKEVRIAIAWRADTDNEFCTNIVEAFREAGITLTVLPQVKASYLSYSANAVATAVSSLPSSPATRAVKTKVYSPGTVGVPVIVSSDAE